MVVSTEALLWYVSLFLLVTSSFGLQNLFGVKPPKSLGSPFRSSSAKSLEDDLLTAIRDLGEDRLVNSERIQQLIDSLEEKQDSMARPAIAPQVYGRWRLLHTNNANTASPIQRKAVDASAFAIYQDIELNDQIQLVVRQVVKFSEQAELRVDALASTSAYPLAELTERTGDGRILGWNILGVSMIGDEAKEDETRPDSRIQFVFDEGNFQLGDSFSVPYPVPFRLPLLRDAVKGWIDITYMSDRLRISRGNKGTTFILEKER